MGTGPYKLVDFKPGDTIRAELFPGYHTANRPYFDSLELKGGGDATSAARAVLQTGEYDFAWNMQVEEEVLKRLEKGGRGRVEVAPGGNIEHIQLNQADPWKDVDGERASAKTTHPFLTDPAVRGALNLLVDRASIHEGSTGSASYPALPEAPARFHSKTTLGFNVVSQPLLTRALEARRRRRARQGRHSAQGRVPDVDQRDPEKTRRSSSRVHPAVIDVGEAVVASFSSRRCGTPHLSALFSDRMYTRRLAPDPSPS